MSEIKRVLWVDDYPSNKASGMFVNEETKKVSSMDEALKEIAGEHLYDYDTIVLDIDFENGLENAEEVIEELSTSIFLDTDQKNKNFVISNGGYLLFLYLLEKGYPSEQVAFLTGNAGIISQLKEYNSQNMSKFSKEDIAELFFKGWKETQGDVTKFLDYVMELPIAEQYHDSELILDCADHLLEDEIEPCRDRIYEVETETVSETIQNTGDKMIFRFHKANLESPIYFSKNDNDIRGHNCDDAKVWLQEKRSFDKVTRWLLLSIGNYIEEAFAKNANRMNQQVGIIFKDINGDNGIRSAFRQMYYVFDGLRIKHRGAYYQAMAAMLIPFEANLHYTSYKARGADDDKLRMMFARCAKQARNYCAHNYFGTTISNETTLFLLMLTTSALLTRRQRGERKDWYGRTSEVFLKDKQLVSDAANRRKIEELVQQLYDNGDLDSGNRIFDINNYSALDCLNALGYNEKMNAKNEQDDCVREAYFVFTLAVYIIKWFDGMRREDIKNQFGEEVLYIRDVAEQIVAGYEYPAL